MNELKIQFGCGSNRLDGWQNHDMDMDITQPLRYPDNCADMVLHEHVAEHLTSAELLRFLDECWRILKPGGKMRWSGPVAEWQEREHARDLALNHGHKQVLNAGSMMTYCRMAGFHLDNILLPVALNKALDGHWRVIGEELDAKETLRLEAIK